LEARYNGNTDGEDDDTDEDDREGIKEDETGNEFEDWYLFTTAIYNLAQNLNKQVEEITAMPYVKFLFWVNYFKLKQETT
jgi:hypothetical protein